MMKAFHTLLQLWGAVQYAVRLYNLDQYNVNTVNPLHLLDFYASAKPLKNDNTLRV